jgi:hypothetical protein
VRLRHTSASSVSFGLGDWNHGEAWISRSNLTYPFRVTPVAAATHQTIRDVDQA